MDTLSNANISIFFRMFSYRCNHERNIQFAGAIVSKGIKDACLELWREHVELRCLMQTTSEYQRRKQRKLLNRVHCILTTIQVASMWHLRMIAGDVEVKSFLGQCNVGNYDRLHCQKTHLSFILAQDFVLMI